jgi:hypothetical protein
MKTKGLKEEACGNAKLGKAHGSEGQGEEASQRVSKDEAMRGAILEREVHNVLRSINDRKEGISRC